MKIIYQEGYSIRHYSNMGNKTLLIFLLVALGFFLLISNYLVWVSDERHAYVHGTGGSSVSESQDVRRLVRHEIEPEAAYETTVGRNLFAPERKEVFPPPPKPRKERQEEVKSEPSEKPEPKPQVKEVQVKEVKIQGMAIRLYGIIMMDKKRYAMINNPLAGKEGDRATIWVKEKDRLGNLTIESVETDRLVVGSDGERYAVLLHQAMEKENDAEAGTTGRQTPVSPSVVSTSAATHEAGGQKEKKASEETGETEEYEIIETPFGTLRRKKK